MNDLSGENASPQPIEQLTNRLHKYDEAIGKVADLHDRTLGTEEGPIQYDLSLIDPLRFPQYHEEASREVRSVKLQLANKTFQKLLEQRDALSDLHGRAQDAEEGFRKAEEEYLTSQGTPEDDKKFEEAYQRLMATKEEIATVFQGRDRKKDERQEQSEKTSESVELSGQPLEVTEVNHGQMLQEENQDQNSYEEIPERSDRGQEVAVRDEGGTVRVLPAKISLDDDEVRHLEWIAKVDLSRVPVVAQLDELAQKVAEIRTGQRPLPQIGDFVEANTKMDNPRIRTLVASTLEGLIATQILLPDGSINSRKGLPMLLAKDLNTLIAMTSPLIVAEAITQMTSVEKGLLCSSLSVAMKEKVGIPDLEFCDAVDAASYLTNAMYDVLKPARDRRIRAQQRRIAQNDIESTDVTWQEPYHRRDTSLPVDVEELLTVIMERDGRDTGFAQGVIEEMFRQNREKGKSQNQENQAGILDNLLEELVDYCEDMDMLGELQEFFSSHPATTKYYRMISRRVDFDRGQKLVEYV